MGTIVIDSVYLPPTSPHHGIWVHRRQINLINETRAEDLREGIAYAVEDAGLGGFDGVVQGGARIKAADDDLWSRFLLLVLAGAAVPYKLKDYG